MENTPRIIRIARADPCLPFIVLFLLGAVAIGGAQVATQTNTASSNKADRRPPIRTVEDWTSLSLANSELHAEKPVFGEKDDFPKFTRELIQVKWRQGDPIDLYIIRPKAVERPPVILYLYSYPSETARFRDNAYCERITNGGFAAIGFVSALTGQRYSNRPMKQWFVSELQEALATTVHDVQMILNYLSARDDLDLSKVGMFGEGSGGSIAILSAAADSRIQTIDVLDPWGDWPDWMAKSLQIPDEERPNYIKPEFLAKIAPLDPIAWLPKLKTEHIRVQQIMDDTTTPKVAKEKIEAAAPPNAQLVEYESTRVFLALWVEEEYSSGQSNNCALSHQLRLRLRMFRNRNRTRGEWNQARTSPSAEPRNDDGER
jgi:hypothetical protein